MVYRVSKREQSLREEFVWGAIFGVAISLFRLPVWLQNPSVRTWIVPALVASALFCGCGRMLIAAYSNQKNRDWSLTVEADIAKRALSIAEAGDVWDAQVWLAQKHGISDDDSLWLLRWLKGEPVPKSIVVELVEDQDLSQGLVPSSS